MKKLALGIVVALLTSVSLAGTISVNLCDWQSDALPSRNPMLSSSLAGAPGVRTNNWNNLMARVAITNTGSSLVYDNGTTIGGAFKIVFTTPRAGQMPTNALSAMGNDALMYSGYDQVWNGQTGTVVLTDIPFSSYDLYIYTDAANANGGGRVSVVGQQDYYLKTKSAMLMTTNTGAGYVQITNTTQASAVSGPQGSGNYVKYSGLSGSGQTFTFAALDMGSVNHRLALNGFQIVQAAEAPPVASFTASPVTGAVPLVVTFTDTSTGTITNRFWTFGDGATSNTTATSVAHTYASTGTYSVALIVSGSLGSSTNTQSNFITASAPIPPTAAFSATPTNGIYPLLVNFTDTSIGTITNRFWNFGDGATTNTTATSVSHTYTSAGTNTVQLIASGPAGANTNTQSNLITVSVPAPPTAAFSATPTSGVVSLMVFFTDNSAGGLITNRYWDFGDGTTTNITATSVSHTYTVGTRTVQLTASGPGGSATNTQVDLIRVEPLPANAFRINASTADQQLTSVGGLANNQTAMVGSASPATIVDTYVIPFQLPTIPAGFIITNAQFSAFLISSYPYAVQQVYVDIFGGRVDVSSTVSTNDWSASTAIGTNIAKISSDYTATNMVKSAVLTGSFFQNIYDADTNAAGKYVFLTLRPDVACPNASANATWATADHATLPKPTLDFNTLDVSTGPCDLVYTNTASEQFVQKPMVTTNLSFVIRNFGYNATTATVSLAANYPWLAVNTGTNTFTAISGPRPVGSVGTVTGLFNVTIFSNAPVGIQSNAFTLHMQGRGTGGSISNFSAPVDLEILNTVFSSISKNDFAADTNGTDSATLTVSNQAAFALSISLANSPAAAWLVHDATVTVPANSSTGITITANGSATPGMGQYNSTLIVTYLNNTSIPNPTSYPVVFDVGPKIEPLLASALITEAGGTNLISGQYEPGEILNITITSTNNGAVTTANIAHTLFANPAYFIVTPLSNTDNYASMAVGAATTTAYQVTIAANTPSGNYTFAATNTAAGSSWGNTRVLNVVRFSEIAKIEPMTGNISIVEASGTNNIIGEYEPGEILNITITSTNNGAVNAVDIAHTLSADGHFAIAAISNIANYASMAVGASTTTTYQVTIFYGTPNGTYTFQLTNSTSGTSWTNSFSLDVINRARPSVSPSSLSITPAVGQKAHGQVVVANSGNVAFSFTITNNAVWGSVLSVDTSVATSVKVIGGTAIPLHDPDPNNSYMNAADSGESDTINIGFAFPFYGTNYTKLYIDSNGAIIFSASNRVGNTNVADSIAGHLPRGNRPLIAPFRDNQLQIGTNSPVRYSLKSNPTRLVIVHTNVTLSAYPSDGTNLCFQTELYADGQIKFSYYNINGGGLSNVAVGIQGDASHYTNFSLVPASGKAALMTTAPDRWISYSPEGDTVPAFSSKPVTFTADGTARSLGDSNSFTATFNWSGGSGNVAISASVIAGEPWLTNANSVLFYGNAGEVTSTTMLLSNAGTGQLNFTITGTNPAASYQGPVINSAVWTNISGSPALAMLAPYDNPYITATNEGFSALQPIGFAFPFYGNVYTQFSAGVNGGISLGVTNRMNAGFNFSTESAGVPQQFIAPYWGNLVLDANASIRFRSTTNELVVTWQKMKEEGGAIIPGTELTFQAVLYASGRIEFRYQQINGFSWSFTKWGIRSGTSRSTSGFLILPGDAIVTTNEYGYLNTNYVNAVSNRLVSLISSNYPIITYKPSTGNILAGETTNITLSGNASGMTSGSPFYNVTNTTQLQIVYERGTNDLKTVDVTFVVTNSANSEIVRTMASALDEEGVGMSYDAKLIAGLDPLDPGAVFAISTTSGRVLSWPYAAGRTYTAWYTLDLMKDFVPLEGAVGLTTNVFTDTVHTNAAAIFYKVTVE